MISEERLNIFTLLLQPRNGGKVVRQKPLFSMIFTAYFGFYPQIYPQYDKCLRAKINAVEPQIINSPPRLSIKPYIFLEISMCHNLPNEAIDTLNTFKLKLEQFLEDYVREVLNSKIKDSLLQDFWCTNKKLYFKFIKKQFKFNKPFYSITLTFEPKTTKGKDLDLVYYIYDIKNRAFIYRGRVNDAAVTLFEAPAKLFSRLKNARNQIISQIKIYNPSPKY